MKFTKEMVSAMQLFVDHRPIRVAYYAAIGAVYVFALTALLNAVRWW